jgi:hypothetical protein
VSLNPFDHQGAYGQMALAGIPLPGVVIEITGADRKWSFDKQKAVNNSGASLNYKGEELADSIKVKCSLTTASHFVDLDAARKALATPKGQKPIARDVKNAILNNQGIKAVQIKQIGQETYAGAGQWTVEWELAEYNPPSPTATGAADASKTTDPSKPAAQPAAADAATQALTALLAKAQAA